MRRVIDEYDAGGRYAVAVTDLQTGETIGVNGERQQLSACVMNLMVILLAMQDVEAGRPLDSVSALVDATIYSSNASTARRLYEIAGNGDSVEGVRRVEDLIQGLGMASTVIDHPPGYPAESTGVSEDNWVTARDANRALQALYAGDVVSEPLRTSLLDRMMNVKPGLNYLMAWGTEGKVSHKNGFFPIGDGTWVDNDVAIVRFERRGVEYAYAISFFSDFVPVKYADIPLAQQLSVMAWEYFSTTYQ